MKNQVYTFFLLVIISSSTRASENCRSFLFKYLTLSSSKEVQLSERGHLFKMPSSFFLQAGIEMSINSYYKPTKESVAIRLIAIEEGQYIFSGPGTIKTFNSIEANGKYHFVASDETPDKKYRKTFYSSAPLILKDEHSKVYLEYFLEQLLKRKEILRFSDIVSFHRLAINRSNETEILTAGTLRGARPHTKKKGNQVYRIDTLSHEVGDVVYSEQMGRQVLFVYYPPEEVSDALRSWIFDVNRINVNSSHEILRLVRRFLLIHPFSNGNGRVAKILNIYLHRVHKIQITEINEIDLIYGTNYN